MAEVFPAPRKPVIILVGTAWTFCLLLLTWAVSLGNAYQARCGVSLEIKTASTIRVTGSAFLLHPAQNGITVTVKTDVNEPLVVTTGGTLVPELLA